MFDKLIEIAVKSAFEKIELKKPNQKNKIIDMGKDSYRVLN